MTKKEIREFKKKVIPRALKFCKTQKLVKAGRNFKKLYNKKKASMNDYANGIYRPTNKMQSICKIPRRQALILANGDVHPCNIVEYSHYPIAGNLFENDLKEIWNGERWDHFRRNYFCGANVDYCTLCPMPLHRAIPLTRDKLNQDN